MINWQKIECFLCVADTLNFTEAAKRLFISQQAVSKHIFELESEMGFVLLERNHHHTALTEAGRRFSVFFRNCHETYRNIASELTESETGVSMLHIGYQNWVDFGDAPITAVRRLRETRSDFFLIGERHSPSTLWRYLDEGSLDIILIHRRFIPKTVGFDVVPLLETPMYLFVAKEDSSDGATADESAFKNRPLIIDALENETETTAEIRAKRECRLFGFSPSSIIVVPNRDTVYVEAEMNRGVFIGSGHSQNFDSPHLAHFFTGAYDSICAVCRPGNISQTIRDLISCLKETYAEAVTTV